LAIGDGPEITTNNNDMPARCQPGINANNEKAATGASIDIAMGTLASLIN
jgi:hypothetical protein